MAKTLFYVAGILTLTMIMGFFLIKADSQETGINPEVVQGEFQKVVLSQEGFNYRDSKASAGKPISLSADGSVNGCLRSVVFNIDGKKYSKYLRSQEDALQLPALPKGTYSFSCTMGMGYGKLIVE